MSPTVSVMTSGTGLSPDQQPAFSAARQLLMQGDPAAVDQWRAIAATAGLSAQAATEARFGLALSLARQRRGAEALEVLQTPPAAPEPREAFVKGLALEAANQHVPAMRSLASYAAAQPEVGPGVWLEVAELELGARRFTESAEAATKGLADAQSRPLKEHLLAIQAQAFAATGDTDAAFQAHRQILALATNRATLGEQLFRLAQASKDLGRRDDAVRALKTALDQFPSATTAAEALRLMDDLGASGELDPFIVGRARYYAVDYRNAVAAFDRYLATEPNGPDAPTARLLRALASLSPGNEPNALRDLDAIADDPTQDTEIAAQALLEAGQALEALSESDQAEVRYQRLLDRFPRLDAAATAGFRLGLVHYVRGEDLEALAAWDALLVRRDNLSAEDVSRALYWRGKALDRLGRADDARDSWQQAAATRPAGFSALRAAGRLGLLHGASTADDERELNSWMAARHLDPAAVGSGLSSDPAWARAQADADLGLFREGNWEADELLQRYPDRTDRLYWLARGFAEQGLTGGAAQLGQAALDAADLDSPFDAPAALRKVAYPLPFQSLVDAAAERYGLDQWLLSASIREASRFDVWADDPATGSRGLARLTPVHMEEAQRGLGIDPNASLTAATAIEEQAWLVADRLRRFSGRPEVVFAAIGTSERIVDGWVVRPGADDPDVFIEQIDYAGTRDNVRNVLSDHLVYAATYDSATPTQSRTASASPASALSPQSVLLVKPEPTAAWIKIARLQGDLPPATPLEPAAQVGGADQRAMFARAAVLQRDGDAETAAQVLGGLAADHDPEVVAAASKRLGEALLAAGRIPEALDTLQLGEATASTEFLIARGLAQLGRCEEALPHFERSIDALRSSPLAAQGQAALAECLQDLGRSAEAQAALSQAVATPGLPRLQSLDLREKVALAKARSGDVDGARADYAALLAGARSSAYRAELNYSLGVLAPDPQTASSHFRAAVQTDHHSRAAQAALDELVALQDPFAAASFEAAETRFEQNRYREALATYTAFLEAHPTDTRAAKASYGRGVSLVRLGQDRAGIRVLESMAERVPGSFEAADGLFRGGRIRESLADLEGASGDFQAVAAQPGAGSRGLDARFRLAFVEFRQGAYAQAAAVWRELAVQMSDPTGRAQSLFWLGKALHAAGDEAGARSAWSSARGADPRGFYGLRAADLLAGGGSDDPRAHPDATAAVVQRHVDDDLTGELRAWAATRGDVAAAQRRLEADGALERADQLLGLGLRREATWELDALAERLGGDVPALALLGGWEHQRGLYNTALVLGYQLASAANVSLTSGPAAVRKLVYPLPHPGVLGPASQQLGVDPLLFSGLMLQESLMDQYVESAAQARGLSQLIASTAYEAARALGQYDFRTAKLFQPKTSITLGAYTFGRRLARYDQRIFPAVAAYNASQFAVDGWLLAAGESDVDTFAEAIPFTETYPYVQKVYENYRQYLELYGTN